MLEIGTERYWIDTVQCSARVAYVQAVNMGRNLRALVIEGKQLLEAKHGKDFERWN